MGSPARLFEGRLGVGDAQQAIDIYASQPVRDFGAQLPGCALVEVIDAAELVHSDDFIVGENRAAPFVSWTKAATRSLV